MASAISIACLAKNQCHYVATHLNAKLNYIHDLLYFLQEGIVLVKCNTNKYKDIIYLAYVEHLSPLYGTNLMQCHTHKSCALELNPLCTKISSIHHQIWVDALMNYVWRKHSQLALIIYLISNSYMQCEEKRSSQAEPSTIVQPRLLCDSFKH